MANHKIVYLFLIGTLLPVYCSTQYLDVSDDSSTLSCDFQKDICGWLSPEGSRETDGMINICGYGGDRYRCKRRRFYVTSVPWIRTDTQSMNRAKLSNVYPASTRKMISEIGSFSFIFSEGLRRYNNRIYDIMSPEIPLSTEHRCLRYEHLVIGNASALVVGYIKDSCDRFDVINILKTHAKSPFIDFSTGSATLPIGSKFKVVFRALYDDRGRGYVFIRSISITSGMCETCGPNEFSCSRTREECIPFNKVCDWKPDCLEGEDEVGCDDSNGTGSSCQHNKEATSLTNTSVLSGDNISTTEVGEDVHLKQSDLFREGKDCSTDSHFCPANCTCSGLSLNCSSTHNLPTYITSITLYNLIGETLNFSRFSNLKKIQITSCKSCPLLIPTTAHEITINSSELETISFIYRYYSYSLRRLSIFDSDIGLLLFDKVYYFVLYCDLNIQNSIINAAIHESFGINGNKVDFSHTRGLSNISFTLLDHLVMNFSSCDLKQLPRTYANQLRAVTLDLRENKLRSCQILRFTQILHLQRNLFKTINISFDTRKGQSRLQYLDFSYNNIEMIDRNDFDDLQSLLYLKLKNNHINYIHHNAFSKIDQLVHLDLSNNHINYLHHNAFSKIDQLIHLDLSNNEIRSLSRSHFIHLTSLKYLNIQNNNLNVKEGLFDGLISIQYLLVDDFTLCCAQPKAKGKVQCLAPVNEISSCDHLIDTPFLRIVIWYIALVAVFGNFCGTLYKFIKMKGTSSSSFVLYSINLGVADFLMGVYLYIIAGANITFSGRYGLVDEWWRHSHLCTLAGVLATLSSETSALFVLLITIDRIYVIRSPLSKLKKNGRIPKFLSGLVWVIALLVALLPLIGNDYFHNYYSGSGICISLPLSVQRKSGWEYSMIVFVGANFLIFIGILIGQVIIFTSVVGARKNLQTHQTTRKGKEISLAKILIAVAITDMLCWIPIGVIGFLTFLGVDITPNVYAWVVVVVLPINSALNPAIYTFSAVIRQMKSKSEEDQKKKKAEFVLKEKPAA